MLTDPERKMTFAEWCETLTADIAPVATITTTLAPVAWLHEIFEPDRDNPQRLLSFGPDNPWSHWLQSHRDKCIYKSTPLFALSVTEGLSDAFNNG